MKKLKKIIPFLLTIGLLCAMSMTALAATALPDLDKKGTLNVTVKWENQPLSGGALKLYQIASVSVKDGSYSYVYTDDFADCGIQLGETQAENMTSQKISAWDRYVKQHKISGKSVSVGKDGTASASGLELGLYLIRQGTAAKGYTMNPAVIPVPMEGENGTLEYNVEAVAKLEPEDGDEPDEPSEPDTPDDSTLPQTGQLWWPVSLLAIGGILLYSIGWNYNRKQK